jgi:hypothetical protein
MPSKIHHSTPALALALAATVALGMTACGKPSAPPPEATAPATAAAPLAAEAPPAGLNEQDQAAAAIAAREQELKAKEVELQLRERELAAQEAAARRPARTTSVPNPVTASRPAATTAAPAVAAPPPPPVTVPSGTPLSVRLSQPYSTKTTSLGEPVVASLASDLVVDGRRVARAGATLRGSVTEVTSGSRKIGAVPALKIDFNELVVADGSTVAVNLRVSQKGQSEKGRDTAKIVGGTAAGAIIGHQIDDDSGKVIGGIIGGAAGAAAAQKTGTEVEIAAGTVVTATVRTAFEYQGR